MAQLGGSFPKLQKTVLENPTELPMSSPGVPSKGRFNRKVRDGLRRSLHVNGAARKQIATARLSDSRVTIGGEITMQSGNMRRSTSFPSRMDTLQSPQPEKKKAVGDLPLLDFLSELRALEEFMFNPEEMPVMVVGKEKFTSTLTANLLKQLGYPGNLLLIFFFRLFVCVLNLWHL